MTIKLEFILFDVIGTTVKDINNGESLILDCLIKAFFYNGCQLSYDRVNHQRGKSKKEAIKDILVDYNHDISLTEKIYSDFIALLKKSVGYFTEMDGASKLFEHLRERNIKIGLGSGLPREFLIEIINQVGWELKCFDYIGSSEEFHKGRPDPIMIFDSMDKLNIRDKAKVLKIGDTIIDIQEGKNAGVKTAAVLTGTQKRDELLKYSPDYLFFDINELNGII